MSTTNSAVSGRLGRNTSSVSIYYVHTLILAHTHTIHTHNILLSFISRCVCVGIAGLFTIFASFVFGSGVVNFIDKRASGIR